MDAKEASPLSLKHKTPHEATPCSSHFFEKKDMMFPCPGLAADFLPFAVVAEGNVLAFFACGSSSEKDSQTASSLVTYIC
jgi:hypothetical protein